MAHGRADDECMTTTTPTDGSTAMRHHHYYGNEAADWLCRECGVVTDYCTAGATGDRETVLTLTPAEADTPRTIYCTACDAAIDPLSVFPGGICLQCYADSPEGRRMPTADEVVAMWGGPVRRSR